MNEEHKDLSIYELSRLPDTDRMRIIRKAIGRPLVMKSSGIFKNSASVDHYTRKQDTDI